MNLKKAIIVGIHSWNSPFRVGTHHITRYLLKRGFSVAHICAPLTPFHRLLPQSVALQERRANHSAGGVWEQNQRLWHYVPYALIAPDNRPFLSNSLVRDYWQYLSVPNVVRKLESAGFAEVDLLFIDSMYQPFWLSAVDYRKSAYRLADRNAGFSGYNRAAQTVETRLVRDVDMVFAASNGLCEYAARNGAKSVTHLPNGVDLDFFAGPVAGGGFQPPDVSRPIAIYVGAFDDWFDHPTIIQLARKRPELNILLLGPMDKTRERYAGLANVHLIGAVPHEQLPAWLSLADVGLIPFNVVSHGKLLNDVNPLKLYEYMACGLPVVSYRWKELESLDSPAVLVDDREQFVEAVSAILQGGASGKQERQFASRFDWATTLAPLGAWIN